MQKEQSKPNLASKAPKLVLMFVRVSIRFRCLKYWLTGESEGKTEIFVKNLPGGPDNINLAPDGTFWIAVLQVNSQTFHTENTSI